LRSIEDQVILITGATDGLGKATARDLASRRATVLLHGRDRARGEATLREIRQATGNDRLRLYLADFSSLTQVRRLTEEVQAHHDRLDVLINNAGTGGGTPTSLRQESQDGFELCFAVNYLAPFLLTRLLLPLLRRSALARIVNVASAGQAPIDFDDVMLNRHYTPVRAYRQSKLAQIMFTFELADRLREQGETDVTVNALHPASLMPTKMVFEMFGSAMSTLEEGTEATVRLVISPELEGVTGRYFDGKPQSRAHEQAYDPGARRRLWLISEQFCGLTAATSGPAR
jgi:NAD(P)-dependent dehydrogenase (short-subunit alcohol dehydrogenase family)